MGSPPGAERRQEPRSIADDPVKVVVASQHVLDAVVMDRSLRGMRLRVGDVSQLSGEVTILSALQGAAYHARVVWRSAPYAGVSITRTVDMRIATGPDTATLRRLWREHVAR